MSPPSHIILPLSGAVVLTAAVIGAWLWPAPPPPQVHLEPLPVATPVFAPPPAPVPRPARPVVRAAPPPPPVVAVEPPRPAPLPMEPVRTAPEPSYAPPQVTAPPQEPKLPPGAFSMRGRAAAMLERNVVQMEQARDQARARGDETEFQRLDTIIRQNRERLEHVRAKPGLSQGPNGAEPPQM